MYLLKIYLLWESAILILVYSPPPHLLRKSFGGEFLTRLFTRIYMYVYTLLTIRLLGRTIFEGRGGGKEVFRKVVGDQNMC